MSVGVYVYIYVICVTLLVCNTGLNNPCCTGVRGFIVDWWNNVAEHLKFVLKRFGYQD